MNYFMAYFYSELNDTQNAMDFLKIVIEEGFSDFKMMQANMTRLKDNLEFNEICKSKIK